MAATIDLPGRGQWIQIGDDGQIVVEWYHFGDSAPYESSNMLVFDEQARRELAAAIGCAEGADAPAVAAALAKRFGSYFAIRHFVDSEGLTYKHEVDLMP